jgi:hypothetical protein
MEKGYIKNHEEFIKAHDLNEAISSGLAKRSYDEEVMYHLKKETSDKAFNMMEVHMFYNSEITIRIREE